MILGFLDSLLSHMALISSWCSIIVPDMILHTHTQNIWKNKYNKLWHKFWSNWLFLFLVCRHQRFWLSWLVLFSSLHMPTATSKLKFFFSRKEFYSQQSTWVKAQPYQVYMKREQDHKLIIMSVKTEEVITIKFSQHTRQQQGHVLIELPKVFRTQPPPSSLRFRWLKLRCRNKINSRILVFIDYCKLKTHGY